MSNKNHAFSLLELAIIFTIIGLIIAGITAGQRLVEQSKIQTFIADIENVNNSVAIFVSTYDNYPGDFSKAQTFFGSADCIDHSFHTELTCDGDGNRKIGYNSSTDGALGESSYVYTHLQLAKIYKHKSTFTPNTLSNSNNYYGVSAVNTPSFDVDGITGYFSFVGISNFATKTGPYALSLGSIDSDEAIGAALTGATAWAVDNKLDDGVFTSGNITLGDDGSTTCSKTEKNAGCVMIYAPHG